MPSSQIDISQDQLRLTSPNRLRRNRDILLFCILAALYVLPFMTFFQAALWEYDAVRVLHGAVFARDFVEDQGPGTFWWNALFMKIFGADFFGARVCLFVTSVGLGTAMYSLARQVCRSYQWLPPVVFVAAYFGGMWPLMNYHTDSVFFSLLAVVFVTLWHDGRKNQWLCAAGFLAAAASYTVQPMGLFLFFAIILWLLYLYRAKRDTLRSVIVMAASYVACMVAPLFYFWREHALRDLIYANFIWPATSYSTVNDVPYGFGTMKYWREFSHPVHGSYALSVFAPLFTAPYFFIDALPFLLVILTALRWKDSLQPKIVLFLLCGAAMWASEFHRKELGHMICGSPLLIIALCYFLIEYRVKAAKVAIQLLAICCVSLAVFNLVMMAGTHPLHTRVGTVRVYKKFPVVTYLEKHTHPGEYIFCFQYCPSYYFLDQLRNPTRYNLLTYNFYTEAQFQEAIREIDQAKVRLVVWQGGATLKTLYHLLPGSDKEPPYGFIMDDYLRSHYHEVKSFSNGMQIWERNGDS